MHLIDINYLIILGQKAEENVLAYSKDGKNFTNISLDSAINKQYGNDKLTNIELGSYPYYIGKRKAIFLAGSGKTSQGDTRHFVLKISKDMKIVTVLTLDDVVNKFASNAESLYVTNYLNYDNKNGYIVLSGEYYNGNGDLTPFYILSKDGMTFNAYKALERITPI